jgi:hypothetical protein
MAPPLLRVGVLHLFTTANAALSRLSSTIVPGRPNFLQLDETSHGWHQHHGRPPKVNIVHAWLSLRWMIYLQVAYLARSNH